jgi:hypothetical protein
LEEWHLTSTGWIHNTAKTRSRDRASNIGVPSDRLLTIQNWEYERSSWSELTGNCEYSFISTDIDKLSSAIEKYGNAPIHMKKNFEKINPIPNAGTQQLIYEVLQDAKSGKNKIRYEDGACSNCGGSGACGKDRTGDDFTCPKCDGTGKSYRWETQD